MSPKTPALSKPEFSLPKSHDAFLREIRCQFIILARKDEPTPDYAQDRVLDEVGRRLLARSLRPAAPADDQPEVIAARLQRRAPRRRVSHHCRCELRVERFVIRIDVTH